MKTRIIVLAVVLAFAGAITLDRLSPAAVPARGTLAFDPAGGVLTCPYLTEPKGKASIQLANLGSSAASVRISIPVVKAQPVVLNETLAPSSVKSVTVPASVKGRSGAVIEYAGGDVVASHTLGVPATNGPPARSQGSTVAPCKGTGSGDIVVTFAATLQADALLALFNPGSADADVTVTLLADGRRIQPIRLARRLVPSHSRRDFELGDFAFNARNVSAVIHANAGRVSAEALLWGKGGAELLPGQQPGTDLVAISGQSGGRSALSVTVIGSDDTGLDVRAIGASQQQSARGFPPSLPPAGQGVIGVPDLGDGAAVGFGVFVNVGSPVVAATRWTLRGPAGRSDFASLPAGPTATRWGAVIGRVGTFATERMIVVNPGTKPVVARAHIVSSKGSVDRTIKIPPGRVVVRGIGSGPGPFGVLLEADGPVAVALRSAATASRGPTTATALFATPLLPATKEGVFLDARAGIPAVLPTR